MLACIDHREAISAICTTGDPVCRAWAAWTMTLLGNYGSAREALTRLAVASTTPERVCELAFQALALSAAHRILQHLRHDVSRLRWLVRGSGITGNPAYASWLIAQMDNISVARVAGEAFSLITGVDLLKAALERPRPANVESGPNDDTNDTNVSMDEDDGLPWPDPEGVQRWWDDNQTRFQPGVRHFMGAPVTREHCIEVLKNGYQRQRILAAHYLCLLNPGTPLFNTSAPAWRQQRLLAEMK